MPQRQYPQKPRRAPLAAVAEPARLIMLPDLATASGGPACAIATGHPSRAHVRLYPSLDTALAALRQMGGEGAA